MPYVEKALIINNAKKILSKASDSNDKLYYATSLAVELTDTMTQDQLLYAIQIHNISDLLQIKKYTTKVLQQGNSKLYRWKLKKTTGQDYDAEQISTLKDIAESLLEAYLYGLDDPKIDDTAHWFTECLKTNGYTNKYSHMHKHIYPFLLESYVETAKHCKEDIQHFLANNKSEDIANGTLDAYGQDGPNLSK